LPRLTPSWLPSAPSRSGQTDADNWYQNKRIGGLWRFAIAISVLNILGHTVLGFEQAWAHPIVALAVAYTMELSLEAIDAWAQRRRARFLGSPRIFAEFLLSGPSARESVSRSEILDCRLAFAKAPPLRQSRANPSLDLNSLLAGKIQGILRNYVADAPTVIGGGGSGLGIGIGGGGSVMGGGRSGSGGGCGGVLGGGCGVGP
jgi:hypothetical protein